MNKNSLIKKVLRKFNALSMYQKLFTLCGGTIIIYSSYYMLFIIAVAMLPTIVTFFVNQKNKEKTFTIGFFNFAGATYWIIGFFFAYSYQSMVSTLSNMLFWISAYGFAALGVLCYCQIPEFFAFALKKHNSNKLKQIKKTLEDIKKQWGEI